MADRIFPVSDDDSEVVTQLVRAILHTQEFAQFPALPGWSWYDALNAYRAAHGLDPLPTWSPLHNPGIAWSASAHAWPDELA